MNQIIEQTQCWLDQFIIAHNICPFAKKERDRESIRFFVDDSTDISHALECLMLECERLDKNDDIETTLLIFSQLAGKFDDYLDFLDIANQLLISQGYEGVYQIASFHPDYQFADSSLDDPANYTNRSPYPMFHIIREASLEKALQNYPHPQLIPQRNIEYCRNLGIEKLLAIGKKCTGNNGD